VSSMTLFGAVARRVSDGDAGEECARLARVAEELLKVAAAEGITGGFGAVYDVLKALEDQGRVRRGYFAGGVAAAQFALPAALDLLRSLRDMPDTAEVVTLAATDPANPYGTMLKYPEMQGRAPTRTVGALVVLVNGALAAYLPRGGQQVVAFLPDDEPARSTIGRALAGALAAIARQEQRGGLLLGEINGGDPARHPLAPFLVEAGFHPSAMGFQMRVARGGQL